MYLITSQDDDDDKVSCFGKGNKYWKFMRVTSDYLKGSSAKTTFPVVPNGNMSQDK